MNLLIPQLRNSVSLFSETLPEYKEDVIDILNIFVSINLINTFNTNAKSAPIINGDNTLITYPNT